MSIEFLITTLVVVISPGSGALYTIAAGLGRGGRASLVAALGCTLGIVPHMSAAITGLAAILHTSALAFEIIKYAGVAYLLWMAWSTLKETAALSVEAEREPKSVGKVITETGNQASSAQQAVRLYILGALALIVGLSATPASAQMMAASNMTGKLSSPFNRISTRLSPTMGAPVNAASEV